MRGLGKGQRVHLLIVQEVAELMSDTVGGLSSQRERNKEGISDNRQPLVNAVAWLVTNSMRSEMIQYLQLQIQIVTNLWRKSAFRALMRSSIPNQQNRRTEAMLTTRFHASKLTEDQIRAAMADIPEILKEDAMTADQVQLLPKVLCR